MWSQLEYRLRHLNIEIFLAGIGLVVVAIIAGAEFAGVKLPADLPLVARGALALAGIGLILLSLIAGVEPLRSGARLVDVPQRPARFVARPDLYKRIRDLLLRESTVAIVGMGGAGKTSLAAAAAHDASIARLFPDGIVWIEVGQRPSLLQLQLNLAHKLGSASAAFTDVEAGKAHLADLMADKAILLVLDDLWDRQSQDALNRIGPKGRVLLTTRDRDIARTRLAAEAVVEVSELEPDQAQELLAGWVDLPTDQLPPIAADICREVEYLALGVAMAGGMVAERKTDPEAWAQVLALLKTADLGAIRLRYPPDNYPHASLLAAIEIGIRELEKSKQDRYRELAVFAGRGLVPPTAIEALWSTSGSSADQTRELLDELVARSLAQRGDKTWVTLHDLQFDVLRHESAKLPGGIVALHSRLLDAYRSHAGGAGWAKGPNDGYYFENLAFHLAAAERHSELNALLLEIDWMRARLATGDFGALLSDYEIPNPSVEVSAIGAALLLSANTLVSDVSLLPGQLIGRLLLRGEPRLRRVLVAIREATREQWLCPITPALAASGGLLVKTLQDRGSIMTAAVSPDGTQIAAAGGELALWNLARGDLVWKTSSLTFDLAVAFSPDGSQILSGGYNGRLRLWNRTNSELIRQFAPPTTWIQRLLPQRFRKKRSEPVQAVAFSPDGDLILSAGTDNNLQLWDRGTGELIRSLVGHTNRAMAVSFSPDGSQLASGGFDGSIRIWSCATGALLHTFTPEAGSHLAVAFSPEGSHVLAGGTYGTLELLDGVTGEVTRTFKAHRGWVHAVAFSRDGQKIASGGEDATVRLWDRGSGELVRTLRAHGGTVRAVAFSLDGAQLVSAGADSTIRIWQPSRAEALTQVEGHTGPIEGLAISPDGRQIASAGAEGTIRIWDRANDHALRVIQANEYGVHAVAFSPDGTQIVSGGADEVVRVWDGGTGELAHAMEDHTDWVRAVAFSPDGDHIASAGDDMIIRIWDRATGSVVRKLEGHVEWIRGIDFSPDGSEIVSVGIDMVQIWNWEKGEAIRRLGSHAWAAAFSPDGRQVASAGYPQVNLFDRATGAIDLSLDGHSDLVRAVAWSSDGKRLVSASDDASIRVWDAGTGREIARWSADAGVALKSCCTVPGDPSLFIYGDSLGGVHQLRLLGSSAFTT